MQFRVDNQIQTVLNQQRPANSSTPVHSFVAAMEQTKKTSEPQKTDMTKEEILNNLSGSSKAVLESMKKPRPMVRKDEWLGLLDELKNMGAISAADCFFSRPGCLLVPFVSYDGGKTYQAARIPDEIRNTMNQHETWPCDPLEYYDSWEFILKNWVSYLRAEMKKSEYPIMAQDFEASNPINSQIAARSRVIGLVKSLIS